MAINPETQYPGKIDPASAEFPYGKARNITLPGDGLGTPWEAALVNDLFGFQQALLSDAGVVPSGTPDEVGASQYLQALFKSSGLVRNDYTLLRLVTSSELLDRNSCLITADGIGGVFVLDKTDVVTVDNDGTIIVDADGGRWKRLYVGAVNVKWFGAIGDGATDDTTSVQNALDNHDHIWFDKTDDNYQITSVTFSEGKTIESNGALLKQPVVVNFTRLFNTYTTPYTGSIDSKLTTISGLIFDGNRVNQGTYLGFEKEQSSLIFLGVGATLAAGRLRVNINNCVFQECTSDGVTVHRQIDLNISNCRFDNCFRGSVTLVGGGSRVIMNNLTGGGDTHPSAHQIEIDSTGFDGTESSELQATNCDFAGGFDVAVTSPVAGSVNNWFYSNCKFGTEDAQPFNTNCDGLATLKAVNCEFGIGTTGSRFLKSGDSRFIGCTFRMNSGIDVDSLIQPGSSGSTTGNRLRLIDCDLTYDSSFDPDATVSLTTASHSGNKVILSTTAVHNLSIGDFVQISGLLPVELNGDFYVAAVASTTDFQYYVPENYGAATVGAATCAKRQPTYGWSMSADSAENDNKTIIKGGSVSSLANYTAYVKQGGSFIMDGVETHAACAYFTSTAGARYFHVEIGEIIYGDSCKAFAIITASVNTDNRITHRGTHVPQDKNMIWTTANINFLTAYGKRNIEGVTPSNAVNDSDAGLAGDEWRLGTPVAASPYSWVAVANGLTTTSPSWAQLGALA